MVIRFNLQICDEILFPCICWLSVAFPIMSSACWTWTYNAGNIEWPVPWQTSGRRQLCTIEGWVPWKCTSVYLWDLLPNTSAHWHGVCIVYVVAMWHTFGSFTNILILLVFFCLFPNLVSFCLKDVQYWGYGPLLRIPKWTFENMLMLYSTSTSEWYKIELPTF